MASAKPQSAIDKLIGDISDDDNLGGGLGAEQEGASGDRAQALEAEAELTRRDAEEAAKAAADAKDAQQDGKDNKAKKPDQKELDKAADEAAEEALKKAGEVAAANAAQAAAEAETARIRSRTEAANIAAAQAASTKPGKAKTTDVVKDHPSPGSAAVEQRPDVVEAHGKPAEPETDEWAGISPQTRAEMELGRRNVQGR